MGFNSEVGDLRGTERNWLKREGLFRAEKGACLSAICGGQKACTVEEENESGY